MKKLGLIIALLGLASGAIYAGTRLLNKKSQVTKNKSEEKSGSEEDDIEIVHSSISQSYVYVADL